MCVTEVFLIECLIELDTNTQTFVVGSQNCLWHHLPATNKRHESHSKRNTLNIWKSLLANIDSDNKGVLYCLTKLTPQVQTKVVLIKMNRETGLCRLYLCHNWSKLKAIINLLLRYLVNVRPSDTKTLFKIFQLP